MTTRRLLDALIVASVALWGASCFTINFYLQMVFLVPLALGYALVEACLPLLRRWCGGRSDPAAAERHRFCILLYMQAITVANPWVAGAVLGYAVLLHLLLGPRRWIAHVVGSAAVASATYGAQPLLLAAWAPVPTLLGLAIWLAATRRDEAEGSRLPGA